MKRRSSKLFQLLVAGILGSQGCVSLDAGPHYEEVAHLVGAATGSTDLKPPEDDESVVSTRVEELLKDGITIDEAASLCLLNNAGLVARLLDVGIARAEFVRAGFISNPTLSMSVRFPSTSGFPNLQAALAQNIADLWMLPFRSRVAGEALKRTILEVSDAVSEQIRETKRAYVQALAADRLRATALENREIANSFLDTMVTRKKAGEASEVEVSLARSQLITLDVAARAAALSSYEKRAELASRLGLTTLPTDLVLSGALPELSAWNGSAEGAVHHALAERLDVQAAKKIVDEANADLVRERLGIFSFFQLGATVERPDSGTSSQGDPNYYTFGPSTSFGLPIFDWNRSGVARAKLKLRQATLLLSGLSVDATQRARAANERVAATVETVLAFRREVVPEREKALNLLRIAYPAGEVPLTSVLTAQQGLLEARKGLVFSLEAFALALIEYERATGSPVSAGDLERDRYSELGRSPNADEPRCGR